MGKLYICGTPIGNLEDVSIRLLKTLRKVDFIVCEDTRRTIKLLNHYKIKKPLISYHEHSKKEKEDYILGLLMEGNEIALVSDAGMPGISDPGENLVKRAIDAEIPVEVIPGPTAAVSALAVSGIDASSFVFVGFLPNKKGKRREEILKLKEEKRTMVFYESPHRLIETLKDMQEIWGEDRRIAVARELTKVYEEVIRASLKEAVSYFELNPPKGEFTLVIEGDKTEKEASLEEILREVKELIESGINRNEAFKIKAREYKLRKSDLYKSFIEKYDM